MGFLLMLRRHFSTDYPLPPGRPGTAALGAPVAIPPAAGALGVSPWVARALAGTLPPADLTPWCEGDLRADWGNR